MPDADAPNAFVLISFESDFDAIYERLIAKPLQDEGYQVERADSRLDQQNILRSIIRGIARADLIVADLTGLNPNVFYELGIAHTLEVPTILLTQDLDTLPFDLRSYAANEYSVNFARASEIADTIREIGEGRNKGKVVFGNPITDFLTTEDRTRLGKGPRASTSGGGAVAVTAPDEEVSTEELGFVDVELQAVEAGEQFTDAMNVINAATETVGEQMAVYTQELEALSLRGGDAKQANLLAIRLAADLDSYANVIEEHLPDVQTAASSLMDSLNRRIALWQEFEGTSDPDQLSALRDELVSFRTTVQESLESVHGYRDSVRGIRGFQRNVNSASARIVKDLDALLAVSENLEAQAGRAIAVIGDLIDESRAAAEES